MIVTDASSGTIAALFLTTSLCLPQLCSVYYQELGLNRPPLTRRQLLKHFFFIYRAPTFKLLTPGYTAVTHMFCHADIVHFVSNLYTLLASGSYCNLGFVRTLAVIYGGGVAGIGAHIIETCFLKQSARDMVRLPKALTEMVGKEENAMLNRMLQRVVGGEQTIVVCGCSAGAYALIGVEVYKIYTDLKDKWFELRQARNGSEWQRYCRGAFYSGVVDMFWRLLGISTQILAVLQPTSTTSMSSIWSSSRQIGYSAHIGGAVFGFLLAKTMKWR